MSDPMNENTDHNNVDGTDFERSPSGGYELVYHILDCEAPACGSATLSTTNPEGATYVCGDHPLDEVEDLEGVKLRG